MKIIKEAPIVNAIIFDVMGVVFKVGDDTNDLLVPFIQKRNPLISRKFVNEIYLEASLGKIASSDFWAEMGLTTNWQVVEREYLDTCLTIDEEFLDVARKLRKRYRLALLSNDISEWSEYLRLKHGIDELIETAVISGDVGVRKPDSRIYDILLARLEVPAENCTFIDDMSIRLKAAEQRGMNTVLFNRDGVEYDGTQIQSFKELLDIFGN